MVSQVNKTRFGISQASVNNRFKSHIRLCTQLGCLSMFLFTWSLPIAQPLSTKLLRIQSMPSIAGLPDWDWTQARTVHVPDTPPLWITTMSQTRKIGSHGYHDIYEAVSKDHGLSWSEPRLIRSLSRHRDAQGFEVAAGDLWPSYHPFSETILLTGKTFNFDAGKDEHYLRERVAYAVKSLSHGAWSGLKTMTMPDQDHSGAMILAANAGCNQPWILPGGDLLLPIRYQQSKDQRVYTSIVARCRFDGQKLEYLEHGSEHSIDRDRGLYEPSVIAFQGRFFLTMRADHSAFVTSGKDGIHYSSIREWRFDDGEILGSYNTQQHWVSAGDGLYLVYTRRGANNDHIFRHRAPLFIAQVDPRQLVVMRETERILMPENDACLGNSGICRLSDRESWVTCGEVRVSYGERKGERNRVLFTRILAGD
jgi:hypothetical protein